MERGIGSIKCLKTVPKKVKLEYKSDILFYRYASVYDGWEEKYKDNQIILSLISKLISAESQNDEGIGEAMEELMNEIFRIRS